MNGSNAKAKDSIVYKVVVNAEEQYSIWPSGSEVPTGWKELTVSGSKEDCLKYIADTWTDMRPLSIRKKAE